MVYVVFKCKFIKKKHISQFRELIDVFNYWNWGLCEETKRGLGLENKS